MSLHNPTYPLILEMEQNLSFSLNGIDMHYLSYDCVDKENDKLVTKNRVKCSLLNIERLWYVGYTYYNQDTKITV